MVTQNSKFVKFNMAESGGHDPQSPGATEKFIGLAPTLWDSLSNHKFSIPKTEKALKFNYLSAIDIQACLKNLKRGATTKWEVLLGCNRRERVPVNELVDFRLNVTAESFGTFADKSVKKIIKNNVDPFRQIAKNRRDC